MTQNLQAMKQRSAICWVGHALAIAITPLVMLAQSAQARTYPSLTELVIFEAGTPRFGKMPLIDQESAKRVVVAAGGLDESRRFDALVRDRRVFARGVSQRQGKFAVGQDTVLVLLTGYQARGSKSGNVAMTRVERSVSGEESRMSCFLPVKQVRPGEWSRDTTQGGLSGVFCILSATHH